MGAASMAGHLKLDNLVWVYDKNDVQLSGPTRRCASDDDTAIYGGFGWRVITIDGHDHAQIRGAYDQVRAGSDRPTLIVAHTVIGKGCATMGDSYKTHGSPLPAPERLATRAKLGLPEGTDFYCPQEALDRFRRNFEARRAEASAWRERLRERREADPAFARALAQRHDPVDVDALRPVEWASDKPIPTRNAFGDLIARWAPELPSLIGGSADLEPSNMTADFAKAVGDFDAKNRQGRNLCFGVREFPMSAVSNGIALHGGLIPFDATFLSFADYSRGALRLGALQRARVIHEFTHDSFHVGEDGPTHQPVEQVMALRAIPDLYVMRPADPVETEVLLRRAIALPRPSALCLSRQKVPFLPLPRSAVAQAARGAYVVRDAADPELLIVATGSEVSLALEVAERLGSCRARVVSMPCWELFEEQTEEYRDAVLPDSVTRRVTIEAGVTLGWERWAGRRGLAIGLDRFGASAPAEVLAREYGFTADQVCERIARRWKELAR
jgi:transketolase